MSQSMYAKIMVDLLISMCFFGLFMIVWYVCHIINKYICMPILRTMHDRMMHHRAMDSTRARYLQAQYRKGGK